MKEYLRINTFRTKPPEFYHVKNKKKKVSMNKAYILHSRFGLHIKEYKSGKYVKTYISSKRNSGFGGVGDSSDSAGDAKESPEGAKEEARGGNTMEGVTNEEKEIWGQEVKYIDTINKLVGQDNKDDKLYKWHWLLMNTSNLLTVMYDKVSDTPFDDNPQVLSEGGITTNNGGFGSKVKKNKFGFTQPNPLGIWCTEKFDMLAQLAGAESMSIFELKKVVVLSIFNIENENGTENYFENADMRLGGTKDDKDGSKSFEDLSNNLISLQHKQLPPPMKMFINILIQLEMVGIGKSKELDWLHDCARASDDQTTRFSQGVCADGKFKLYNKCYLCGLKWQTMWPDFITSTMGGGQLNKSSENNYRKTESGEPKSSEHVYPVSKVIPFLLYLGAMNKNMYDDELGAFLKRRGQYIGYQKNNDLANNLPPLLFVDACAHCNYIKTDRVVLEIDSSEKLIVNDERCEALFDDIYFKTDELMLAGSADKSKANHENASSQCLWKNTYTYNNENTLTIPNSANHINIYYKGVIDALVKLSPPPPGGPLFNDEDFRVVTVNGDLKSTQSRGPKITDFVKYISNNFNLYKDMKCHGKGGAKNAINISGNNYTMKILLKDGGGYIEKLITDMTDDLQPPPPPINKRTSVRTRPGPQQVRARAAAEKAAMFGKFLIPVKGYGVQRVNISRLKKRFTDKEIRFIKKHII